MMLLSKSPERELFQKEAYIKRCHKDNREPDEFYLKMFDDDVIRRREVENIKEFAVENLEYDLRTTAWIVAKAQANDYYAQNIYAALCNIRWQKIAVIPILADQYWTCSWRSAGSIVADMLEKGDYIDWYCSGILEKVDDEQYNSWTQDQQEEYLYQKTYYVAESVITDEIREDFLKLGWQPSEWPEDK